VRDILKSPFKAMSISLFIACWLIYASYPAFAGTVLVQDQKITVHAKNTPLRDILQNISQQANLEILYYGTAGKTISIDLNSMPMEDGLRRLLSGSNFSFLYQKSNPSDLSSEIVLSRITIITEGNMSAPMRFGAQPEPPAVQMVQELAPAAAPVTAAVPADNTLPSGQPADGLSFSRTDREIFKKISKDELVSQVNASQVDVTPGVAGRPANPNGYPEKTKGLRITNIQKDSLFSQIGLKNGDIIHNVNGTGISSGEQLADAVQRAVSGPGSGPILRIEVERDNKLEPVYVEMK
jgi:hypothetical protein